jgi:prolyl oligopeptidase
MDATAIAATARRDPTTDLLHGCAVPDPYRWLEDGDATACAAWLAGQDAAFTAAARAWPGRDAFRALLADAAGAGGAATPVASPPVWRRGRRFALRRAPGQRLPVLVTAPPGGAERVLLDPLALDPSGAATLDSWRPSPSGRLLAYQVSRGGDERPLLRVLDTARGTAVGGTLAPGRVTAVAWLPDDSGFYYVDTPGHVPGRRLRLHRVGVDPAADPVLLTTDLPQMSVTTAPGGRHVMVSAAPGATSGNLLWLAEHPRAPAAGLRPVLVHDGTADGSRAVLRFAPGGRVYAVTDSGAPFGRLCAVDPARPGSAHWREVVAEDPGAVLGDCAPLTDPATGAPVLLLLLSREGAGVLRVHTADGALIADIPAPGPGGVSRLTAPPDGGPAAWCAYSDFTTPPAVYRVDLGARRCVPDPGGPRRADPPAGARRPEVRALDYPSHDGVPVRLHLVAPSGADGPLPTLLTAYGGFGASTPPAYSPAAAAWVRAGGAYAVAHVRGGGERGTGWHAAGRGAAKPVAIDDFTAAARWLVEQRWTAPDRLAVRGASHSGLLVAAAVTRRPDLYAAAVCSDAVTDMLRYHRFGQGRLWTEEFGTADDPGMFATLLGYSPYHRVRPGTPYPAVLLTCARTDPRVDSLHTRKLAAALQHATASGADRPVLLRCEDGVGHGLRSLDRWLALQTDVLAFCAAHTGLRPPDGAAAEAG